MQTLDFSQEYVLGPSLKRMHELKIGAEVLDTHVCPANPLPSRPPPPPHYPPPALYLHLLPDSSHPAVPFSSLCPISTHPSSSRTELAASLLPPQSSPLSNFPLPTAHRLLPPPPPFPHRPSPIAPPPPPGSTFSMLPLTPSVLPLESQNRIKANAETADERIPSLKIYANAHPDSLLQLRCTSLTRPNENPELSGRSKRIGA